MEYTFADLVGDAPPARRARRNRVRAVPPGFRAHERRVVHRLRGRLRRAGRAAGLTRRSGRHPHLAHAGGAPGARPRADDGRRAGSGGRPPADDARVCGGRCRGRRAALRATRRRRRPAPGLLRLLTLRSSRRRWRCGGRAAVPRRAVPHALRSSGFAYTLAVIVPSLYSVWMWVLGHMTAYQSTPVVLLVGGAALVAVAAWRGPETAGSSLDLAVVAGPTLGPGSNRRKSQGDTDPAPRTWRASGAGTVVRRRWRQRGGLRHPSVVRLRRRARRAVTARPAAPGATVARACTRPRPERPSRLHRSPGATDPRSAIGSRRAPWVSAAGASPTRRRWAPRWSPAGRTPRPPATPAEASDRRSTQRATRPPVGGRQRSRRCTCRSWGYRRRARTTSCRIRSSPAGGPGRTPHPAPPRSSAAAAASAAAGRRAAPRGSG